MLKTALSYYEQFAAQRKNDPRLREKLANAYFRVGQITREMGTKAQAMDAFRSALEIWGPLVDANPKSHELAGNLAECYLAMGRLESISDDDAAALKELKRSSEILERVTKEDAAEPRYQASLADCYCGNRHRGLAKLGKPDESLAIHEKARAIQQTLVDKYPDNLSYKEGLTANLNAIGFAYYKRKEIPEALRTFHDVEQICQSLMNDLSSGPTPTWLLHLLALTQSNIGNIHKEKGALEQALPFFEKAISYRSDLVDQNRSVTRFREKLAASYREIAELEHRAHQDAKAISSMRRSTDFFRDLVRAQPETARFHNELALSLDGLGRLHDEARNNTEAMRAFESAVREQKAAIAQTKPADELERILSFHLDNLGEQYFDLGQPNKGLPHYEEALKIRRELCQSQPQNQRYADDLVKALFALGTIRRHLGDADAALQLFAEARKALEGKLESRAGGRSWLSRLSLPSPPASRPTCGPTKDRPRRPGICLRTQSPGLARSRTAPRQPTSWRRNGSGAAKRSGTSLVSCGSSKKRRRQKAST